MHYRNCAFSKHQGCADSTPDLQTIVPRECHIDVVGGGAITALDYDGIRAAYAPNLQKLFANSRRPDCETRDYSPNQLMASCGPNCATATAVSYRKIDTHKESWCGFVPTQNYSSYCVPTNKTYISHWWDDDPNSCGFPPRTRHELWVECGCPVQTVSMRCTDSKKFTVPITEDWVVTAKEWRIGRIVYFHKILSDLLSEGLVSDNVYDSAGTFYQLNYLDPKFETKLARARAGLYSYARWRRSIEPEYVLGIETFNKIAAYRQLRTIQ